MPPANTWQIRIVSKPSPWWSPFKEIQSVYLVRYLEGRKVMIGASEKGWGAMLDCQQFSGEVTYQHLNHTTFYVKDGTADEDVFWYLVGRKEIDGYKLSGSRAIAYLFNLRDWQDATPESLKERAAFIG